MNYVKKIEAQAKKWFSYKKDVYLLTKENMIDKALVQVVEISRTKSRFFMINEIHFPFLFSVISISMFYLSISTTTIITTIIGNQASFNSVQPLVKRIQNQGAAKYVTKNFKKVF